MIDAAARAEQLAGHQTLGIAVSGSTAQRLGQDSPALAGADADPRRARLACGARPARRRRATRRSTSTRPGWPTPTGSTGSPRSSSAPGQSSWRSATARSCPRSAPAACSTGSPRSRPSAELSNVRRTLDPDEQRAWADLRAGRSDRAMAHYHARGQLHMADTRDRGRRARRRRTGRRSPRPPDRARSR